MIELLQLILEQLEHVVMYHRATVSLLDQDMLIVVAGKDKMGGKVVRATYPAHAYPLNAQVLSNKQPVLLPDVTHDQRWQPTDTMQGIRSFILAPLLVQEQPIGILSVGRLDGIPYNDDDAQTVFAFKKETGCDGSGFRDSGVFVSASCLTGADTESSPDHTVPGPLVRRMKK